MKIKVLAITPYYLPGFKGGGPIKTIRSLFASTSDEVQYKLITSDRDIGDTTPYDNVSIGKWNNIEHINTFYLGSGINGYIQLFKILYNDRNTYDILYLNSFFSFRFSILPKILAARLNKQIVLAPRGEFSKGALSIKRVKKKAFITLCNYLNSYDSTLFQASSFIEAADIIKHFDSEIDVFVAENITSSRVSKQELVNKTDILKIITVSRISPIKNLLVSLHILKNVKSQVIYHIYGPIEDQNYWVQCKTVIADLPDNITVKYKGVLSSNEVVHKMFSYDVFLMPTKGENYGHVIAEALCAGLPLIISDQTPWRDLAKLGIGWDIPLDQLENFSATIENMAKMPANEHRQMRESILIWSKEKFTKRDAIEANIAMFHYAYNKNKE